MVAKDKGALMAAMRERRKREGMVQVNLWVRREDVCKVRKFVLSLNRRPHNSNG